MGHLLKVEANVPAPVLLVEDDKANILVMTMFLRELGYQCDVAMSGIEALEKFSSCAYSLIIMDLNMPRMCGLETARRMREWEKEQQLNPTPILATTGNASDLDREQCFSEGMNEYLSKPFRLSELETKMLELIA